MIRRLQVWLLPLALLLVAACQQPGAESGAASKTAAGAPTTSQFHFDDSNQKQFFPDEIAAMQRELTSRMVDACFSKMTERSNLEQCWRDRLADAFDDSGKGRGACAHFTDTKEYSECLAVGNTVLDVRRRLNDTTPVSAKFWSSPDEMVKAFIKSILIQGADSCGLNKSEAAAMDCLDHWLTDKLDMPSELLDRCPHGLANGDRQACFGQAVALRYMREHVGRISGTST